MSIEIDDNQALTPKDLVFILAIAGRLDAQSRIVAQELDKDRNIYYGYAVLDSLSSSYSMFKYFFDVFIPNSNSDMMHDFMLTPAGIITAALETIFLVGFSVLAVKFDNEQEDNYKKFIATAWPYFRDIIKGLKNAYRGWRSAVLALDLLGIVDINFLIAPVGLLLGILAAANRFWLRSMLEARKTMMTTNGELKSVIKKLFTMTEEESNYYFSQIKYQSDKERLLSFISVGIGGFLDGLYLYVGVLGLAILSSPMLSVMGAISIFYTLACVVTRIYEEYDFQLRLLITQSKCKLEIIAKQTEAIYAKLLSLQEKENKTLDDLYEIKILKAKIFSLLEQFESNRLILGQQSNRTYCSAALLGLKNGLYAYGALASGMFLISTMLAWCGMAFPPALLMISVILSLAFIAYFVIHSLAMNYMHLQKESTNETHPYNQLIDMKNKMKFNLDIDDLPEMNSFHQSIQDGLAVDSSPQFFIQEWCEVLRSLFSGFGKGQKFVEFTCGYLQIADEQGHYHDSTIMYVLSVFSALLFGGILAFRALARGLGRAPLGQDPVNNTAPGAANSQSATSDTQKDKSLLQTSEMQTISDITEEKQQLVSIDDMGKEYLLTDVLEGSIQRNKSETDSRQKSNLNTSRSPYGFFESKNNACKKQHPPHSASDASLSSPFTMTDDTILGLS